MTTRATSQVPAPAATAYKLACPTHQFGVPQASSVTLMANNEPGPRAQGAQVGTTEPPAGWLLSPTTRQALPTSLKAWVERSMWYMSPQHLRMWQCRRGQ